MPLNFWTNSVIYCGHCHTAYPTDDIDPEVFIESDDVFILKVTFECHACGETNFFLQYDKKSQNEHLKFPDGFVPIWPFLNDRPACPPEVPSHIADDYEEACLVLRISPKASAALSRLCLQNLLRDATKIVMNCLADEIQEVIKGGRLPSHIVDSLEAIRHIGNIAAHPEKDTNIIMPVEPNEARWCLDILESLFDFYYVQPTKEAQRRAALNAKFQEAGKRPPMK